jgi:extradiol dioxygenase family protein
MQGNRPLFFLGPCVNALEFKAINDLSQVFAMDGDHERPAG